jgi:hypothetical protein
MERFKLQLGDSVLYRDVKCILIARKDLLHRRKLVSRHLSGATIVWKISTIGTKQLASVRSNTDD